MINDKNNYIFIILFFIIIIFLINAFAIEKNNYKDIEYNYLINKYDKNTIDLILKYCNIEKIDCLLFISLIENESNFNPFAFNLNKNGSIDRGLCQLNNYSFPDFKKKEFYNIENNIKIGTNYFKWCIIKSGSIYNGLICYNGGIGNFKRKKIKIKTYKYAIKILLIREKLYNEIIFIKNKGD